MSPSELPQDKSAHRIDRPVPLRERVYQAIQELIISRQLAPGQHLVESELAELLGVSRQPIREALQTIRDNKWNIEATIEFEIPGPAGPDGRPRAWTMDERMQEMARCVQYCKTCLLG